MPPLYVSALYKTSCWPSSFRTFWKKLRVKYLCQLHVKYRPYWLVWIKITAVLNWKKKNLFRIYGYQTRGWTDTTHTVCVDSYGFSFINAKGTQEVSQECNKLKDELNKWTKRGERITQKFGELISHTSQSQWPRGLRRGICGRCLAGTVSSNTAGGMDICLLWMLCCQVQVSASGWLPFQRSSTNCGVSIECDCKAPSWETMARNEVEAAGGGRALVQKPRENKEEERGTD